LETITIEAATHESGRVLYSVLSAFYPEWDTDAGGKCVVSVRSSSETQTLDITDAIELHLADGADDVNSVTFALENDHYSAESSDSTTGPVRG
jgi:hypothetical protein